MHTSNQTVPEKALFSLFSGDNPELVANPFALFAQMRSVGAVMPLPLPLAGTDRQVWAVTRMEEAVQVLKDHAHFTVDPRPLEIADQQIKQGDMLFPILGSANRDESQFTQPEDLDIVRTLNRHLAFGHGIHTCLGAPLARLEGDVAFTTLLGRIPNLRLSVPRERITWNFSLNSRSLAALPVAF
jgi:cytochrome P450